MAQKVAISSHLVPLVCMIFASQVLDLRRRSLLQRRGRESEREEGERERGREGEREKTTVYISTLIITLRCLLHGRMPVD